MVPAPNGEKSQRGCGNVEEKRWEGGREGTTHEMRTALAWSWSTNMRARVELSTFGSGMMENLPMYLERGGSAKRASMSSSDH
jgi:hypothetical protein